MAADRFPPQTARLLQLLPVIADHRFSPLTSSPLRRRCPTQLSRSMRTAEPLQLFTLTSSTLRRQLRMRLQDLLEGVAPCLLERQAPAMRRQQRPGRARRLPLQQLLRP